MSVSCGIVGLPNAGKSTLFKALTSIPVLIKDYPFTTIEPNVGLVPLVDERLDSLASISEPEKITPAYLKIVDVAG
ncbi:MAG: redox-regulated ATPase YchF, partial [Firmicutes bacterium]|nr:redox-regulated ATPase YchF [Bacillota bacterium]